MTVSFSETVTIMAKEHAFVWDNGFLLTPSTTTVLMMLNIMIGRVGVRYSIYEHIAPNSLASNRLRLINGKGNALFKEITACNFSSIFF
jgi:hypothetical protein